MTALTGQCLCGAVRYRIAAKPKMVAICHCDHCQRQGGSAFSVNAFVARADFAQYGTTRIFADKSSSGDPVYRHFCPECGSPILSAMPAQPDHVLVKVGTMDTAATLTPTHEYWCSEALPWVSSVSGTIRSENDT